MSAPGWDLTIAVFLVVLAGSAFFSGCETGYMTVSRARLRRSGRSATIRGRRLEKHLQSIEEPILTCLIGTNLFNVLGSAFVTVAFTARWGTRGEWYALAAVSSLIIVFGEILPKVLYREYPERLVLGSVPALSVAMALVAPVRWLLRGYSALWRRLLPRPDEGAELDRRSLAALLLTNSVPTTDDRRFAAVLQRYMKLAVRPIAGRGRPLDELVTVSPDTIVGDALREAARSGHSRLPVRKDGDLVAYVLVRDLIFLEREMRDRVIPRRLWRSLLVVDGRMSPYEVFEELRGQDRQLAVIAAPGGNPTGMITLEDLIEAVVGSIADEFDLSVQGERP